MPPATQALRRLRAHRRADDLMIFSITLSCVDICSLQVAVLQEAGLYSCHAGAGIPQQLEMVLRRAWQVKKLADVLWETHCTPCTS